MAYESIGVKGISESGIKGGNALNTGFIKLTKKQDVESQVGSIVNQHMEEAKEEVKSYKQELKNWTPEQ